MTGPRRCVLYARTSGDDRDRGSLGEQLQLCREYAERKGYIVVAELAEDSRGVSGADMGAPKLNEALEMARAGQFDVFVVRELDRLARRLAKQLVVEEEFRRAGVSVDYALESYDDSPEGALMKNVKAVISEFEREKIKQRMVRGRRNKSSAGNVIVHGRPPYGYREAEENGKRALAIHEPEAEIVRPIFRWYTQGDGANGPMPLAAIAQRLTEMGVPTMADIDGRMSKRRGRGVWNRTALRKMIRREAYAGTFQYGKVYRNSKGANITNPRDQWIAVDVPAIVSRETWEAAQRQLERNRESKGRKPKHCYLLSRRAKCWHCDGALAPKTVKPRSGAYSYYFCAVASKRLDYARECEQNQWFRADCVDATVWRWLRDLMSRPKVARKGLMEEQAERDRLHKPLRDRLAVIDELLTENRAQLTKLLDLYLSGDFPKEMLTERRARLEQTIAGLEREQAELAEELEAQTLTDEQIEDVVAFLASVGGEALEEADEDFSAQRRFVDLLDVRCRLEMRDGRGWVHICCRIGRGSLSLSDTNL